MTYITPNLYVGIIEGLKHLIGSNNNNRDPEILSPALYH